MSRQSSNEEVGGVVRNGFDYDLQVWIIDYVIQACGHPESINMTRFQQATSGCNQCRLTGHDVRKVVVK